ncbi:MAG: hypothetical protein WCS27_02735 [Victivallaceae bacterium]
MGYFIGAIFFMVYVQTAVLFSVFYRRLRLILIAGTALGVLAFYQRVALMNFAVVQNAMNDMQTLVWVCTLAMSQSLIALLFLTARRKRQEEGRGVPFYMYLALAPPLLFPVGVLGGMVFLFNSALGWSFRNMALSYVFAVFALLELLAELFVVSCPAKKGREETVAGIYLLTVVATMFLPPILSGGANTDFIGHDYSAVYLTIPCALIIIAISMLLSIGLRQYKLNKNWRCFVNEFYGKNTGADI